VLLAALVAATAGTAGAGTARQRVYRLDRDEWFRASRSRLSCGAFVPKAGPGKGRMTFECAIYPGTGGRSRERRTDRRLGRGRDQVRRDRPLAHGLENVPQSLLDRPPGRGRRAASYVKGFDNPR